MKTLYIVRHAKSSWEDPGLSDDERPLIKKGVKRTHKIAAFLKERDITVDAFISSHAVRAFETARIIAQELGFAEGKILSTPQLYHASTNSIFSELFGLSDNIQSAMIFGHNPTFTSFANQFLDDKIDWLPTSAVVAISFKTDKWNEIGIARHTVDFVVAPKDL